MKRPRDIEFKIKCGCIVTHTRIIKPCPPCDAAVQETHQRWAQDHRALVPAGPPEAMAA